MILNPLKKENNTEALVKALEDANAADSTNSSATTTPTDNTIPSDPVSPSLSDTPVDTSTSDTTAVTDTPVDATVDTSTAPASTDTDLSDTSVPATDETVGSTDSSANLSFEGNDLPDGLSSDAEAHLETPVASGDSGELDGVKKSALEQLRPLIEKLGLEPADKFDKYLMMLRASDDPTLIKPAFDAAQGITGEKEKAQALLDIINEINYINASKQTPPTV